ncbi:putative glycerol-3-phosphate transporter 1 isoform X2 [Eurytemora carolleeae]|uniref:putative glycerol-3-phosphate transporter 1 isoform X2 n=1 Tax=Eurytemora carolleeae TaxID=1294199 RepID=UPI000C761660|nr:putative glycerol-3-phosphate transporter 1 isoform X2 [Eurytemora carolleeae]|eukprot:XP_023332873.1 putative glycerol-3-phosphate transporter 1 isoform X2 [Eurytemora affinis]
MNTKRRQFINFSLVWLAYCSTYFIRKPLGVVKTVLGMELGLNMSELGWLDVAAILPYAAVQIGYPGLSSKYGAQITLRICLVGAAVSSVFSSLVSSFSTLVLALLFTGVFLAPCWPACSLLLSTWFPSSKHNFVFGLINTATYSGGLGGTALATALLQYSGWRSVFLAPALLAVLVSVFLLCILPIQSENIVRVSASGEKLSSSLGSNSNQPSLVKIPAVRELCICMFCLKFVRYFMYMWLPLYLVQHLEYSALQAGFMSTLFDIGGIFGSPLLGILLDKWFSHAPMKPVSIVMMAGVLSLALFIITSTWGRLFNGKYCHFVRQGFINY